ncbi:O-antigen ligase family protein [Desulfosudis oleivorans]|nr:O-antigen ligase family protein [Desulfosudis oleivorans]
MLLYFALLYFLRKHFISVSFILCAALLSLGIQGVNGIYQYFVGIDILKHRLIFGGHRLTAAVHNPNLFGFLMMIGALSILGTIRPARLIKTGVVKFIFLCLLLGMFFFCLLYSGSRAAWLSLAFGIFLFFLLRFKNWNRAMKIFAITIVLTLPVLLLANDLFIKRMGDAFINYGHRPGCWQGAVSFIADAPVFGHGIRDDMIFLKLKRIAITSPHNAYLEVMVLLGFVGFLIYGRLIWTLYCRALKLSVIQPAYCLMLTGMMVSAFFGHSFITDQILLSACCLLCACMWFHGDPSRTSGDELPS